MNSVRCTTDAIHRFFCDFKKAASLEILFLTFSMFLSAPLSAEDAPLVNKGKETPWTAANYARFSPESFRQYSPAKQILRREKIDNALLAAAIFYATNEQRALQKRPPLTHSSALHRSAQSHSKDMVESDFFAHDNPRDPSRRTPWQRMAAEGVGGGYRSENISKSQVKSQTYLSAAEAIVAMWMKSPGHRRNMLDPRIRFLGVGVHACRCPQFHILATQNFSSAAPD